jgi:hypothetical protein
VNFTQIPITWCLVKSCEDGMLVTYLELREIPVVASCEMRLVRAEELDVRISFFPNRTESKVTA